MGKKSAAASAVAGTSAVAAATAALTTQGTEMIEEDYENSLLSIEEESIHSSNPIDPIEPIAIENIVQVKSEYGDFIEAGNSENGNNLYFSQKSAINNLGIFSEKNNVELSDYRVNGALNSANSLLGVYSTGDHGNTKSSLRISADKITYKNGKWKGTFTWFGSFAHNNKGFVTFNIAKTSDAEKKLILTGGFYVLKRKNEQSYGTIQYQKKIERGHEKILDKTNFNKYFPKPYGYTKNGKFDEYYYNNGGFINGVEDLDKICMENDSECLGEANSSGLFHSWEGSGNSGYDKRCDIWPHKHWCDPVYNGSGNANDENEIQGFDYMYGKVGGNFRLKDHLQSFYKGAGKKVK